MGDSFDEVVLFGYGALLGNLRQTLGSLARHIYYRLATRSLLEAFCQTELVLKFFIVTKFSLINVRFEGKKAYSGGPNVRNLNNIGISTPHHEFMLYICHITLLLARSL